MSLDNGQELVLKDVKYVPGIKKHLLFVGQMDLHGYTTLFGGGLWKLKKGSMVIVKGCKKGTLYCLQCKALPGRFLAIAEFDSRLELWHKRLGHEPKRA